MSPVDGARPGDMARSFVAVFPPPDVLSRLAALRGRLDLVLPGVRWTAERNLHFTLRFFGDLTPARVTHAAEALDAVVPRFRSFPLELAGIGAFPDWKRPRILWVGSGDGGEALVEVARALKAEFRRRGLGHEDKPFVPHVTVGRWREPARGLDPERARAVAGGPGPLGTFEIAEVSLVKSVLAPGGSIYTPLHVARLGTPDPFDRRPGEVTPPRG